MAEPIKILRECGRCHGDGLIPNGYYDPQGNWIDGGDEPCSTCKGTGKVEDLYIHEDFQAQIDDMQDTINDILDKCNDILEKLNE